MWDILCACIHMSTCSCMYVEARGHSLSILALDAKSLTEKTGWPVRPRDSLVSSSPAPWWQAYAMDVTFSVLVINPRLQGQALCWLSHLSGPGSVFLESPIFPNSANFSIKGGQSCNLAQHVKPVILEKSSQNPGILVTHPVLGFNLWTECWLPSSKAALCGASLLRQTQPHCLHVMGPYKPNSNKHSMCVVCPDWETTSVDLISRRQHKVQGCASEKGVVTQGLVASAEKWAGRWSLLLGLRPAAL